MSSLKLVFNKLWTTNKYMCMVILISLFAMIVSIFDLTFNLVDFQAGKDMTTTLIMLLHISIVVLMPFGWGVHRKQMKEFEQKEIEYRKEMEELFEEMKAIDPNFEHSFMLPTDSKSSNRKIAIIYFSVLTLNVVLVMFDLAKIFKWGA